MNNIIDSLEKINISTSVEHTYYTKDQYLLLTEYMKNKYIWEKIYLNINEDYDSKVFSHRDYDYIYRRGEQITFINDDTIMDEEDYIKMCESDLPDHRKLYTWIRAEDEEHNIFYYINQD